MKAFLKKYDSRIRWVSIGLVVTLSMLFALDQDMTGFVQTWGGKEFRALGGAFTGWFIGRFILKIDLSSFRPEDRALGGLSMAVLIAGFANAVV